MALVKGLLELHGGQVEAWSNGLGEGSEFVVRLPLNDLGPPAAPLPANDSPPRTTVSRRVLVADDNIDAADSVAMLLGMAGHEVRVAHDGRAALLLAQEFRPEVALLDIGMPEVNGYEVAKALRQQHTKSGIYLIALGGWARDGDQELAAAAGFDRHLTKPVDPIELEALLQSQR